MSAKDERIPFAVPDIGEAEIEAVSSAMRSGWLTTGPNCLAFESEFRDFLGGSGLDAVAVNSATAGLHLALEALGVGIGDEVLVPTWTFTSTAEVVSYLGATPVLVDVDPRTFAIDLHAAQQKVTSRTKAIMPVHFAGNPISVSEVERFARRNNLFVVEDAAHSFPSASEGVPIGASNSDAIVFSFYATKTMTTGEGGMVITRNESLAKRMRIMRLHGISRNVYDRYNSDRPNWYYEIVSAGFKYNLTDMAAAMGRVQLARSESMRDKREATARFYMEQFGGVPGLRLPDPAGAGDIHSWHLFVVEIGPEAALDRNDFIAGMSELGIGTSVHFIPLHLQPHWRDKYGLVSSDFPIANAAAERVVSLPIFSGMTSSQEARVAKAVRSLLE